MENYTIYKHTSPSGKVYIGQTKRDVKKRWNNGYGYASSPHFDRAIKKYGWNNIQHEIIATGLTKKEANWLEQYLISYYHSNEGQYGYNITKGGDGSNGRLITKEERARISESNKGRKASEETKQKMSEAQKKFYAANPDACKKRQAKRRIAVDMLDMDGNYIKTFPSVKDAAQEVNTYSTNITKCCKGKKGSHRNHKWRYAA